MYALDAFTGSIVWQTGGFGMVDFSTPAYDGSAIYFGDFNSEYVSLDATDGSELWRTSVGGEIGSSVAYANGFVYGTSWDSNLYVLDAFNGDIVESHPVLAFGSTSMPAVSDGWVWIEDNDGRIYGFFGQLPVGVIISPSTQARDAIPDSQVDYAMTVTNVGVSGPDTFDATVTLGALGWTADLYQADGVTPLSDTDGDTIPDTGSLATGEGVTVIARVTVPAGVNPGDKDTSLVTFTSSNDLSVHKTAKLTTTVPPPGVAVGPRAYFTPNPGDVVTTTMDVRNTGGFPDTIDMTATSAQGWDVVLFQADGVTPLDDTDSDGTPDVGLVPGLESASIVVQVTVPPDTPLDTLDRVAVTGTSSLDPNASGTGYVVLELILPPNEDWPTFHNNKPRHGQSPAEMDPPLTEYWSAGPNLQQLWTGPVVADGILFSTTLDGYIRARDPFSGDVLWSRQLGGTYYYTGTPTIADGVVYVLFYGDAGGYAYAFDEATGETIWSVGMADTGLDFNSRVALAYADGMIFGADWTGKIYALSAADGSVAWTYDTLGDTPFGGATVSGGLVFMPSTNGMVYAIDEFGGALVWSLSLDGTATSPLLYAQGAVFEGTYSGTMYAIDAQSGAIEWTTGGFGMVDFSTPAYDGSAIYFGDFNNEYVALDVGDGHVLWQTPIGASVGSAVAVANGYVYGTAWDGYLHVLNASDGSIVDEHQLNSWASTSSPAISRGWVWVEDYDGNIYGFGAVGAGEVRGVSVLPDAFELPVTTAALVRARGIDAFDNAIKLPDVTWASLDGLATILPVSSTGDLAVYVAGAVAGLDTLEASSMGYSGTAAVEITPGPLDHVEILPSVATVEAGDTLQFGGVVKDRFGNEIPGVSITWDVIGTIGAIDQSGLFTASTTVGAGIVTATAESATTAVSVTIVPAAPSAISVSPSSLPAVAAGSLVTLTATVQDAYGNAVSGGVLTWSSTSGTLLPFSTDGRLYGYTAPTTRGSATITVSSGSLQKTVAVEVVAGPPAAITVGAPSPDVAAGETLAFTAVVTDAYGNEVSGVTVLWTTTGGSIDASGVLTAPAQAGTIVVSASAAARQTSVTIEVTAAALDHLETSSSSISVLTGSGDTLAVVGVDAYGNEVEGLTYTWSTTIGTVAAGPGGRTASFFAGDSGGSGTITVAAGGMEAEISVTVTESALPFGRQATQATSIAFLVIAIVAIAVSVLLFARWRAAQRELEGLRKGGGGGAGGAGGETGGEPGGGPSGLG
jgi:outer membrane protein assembly factor BamB